MNLPMVQAQDRVRHGYYDPTNPDEVYRVYLHAYGDEKRAQDAKSQSLALLVDQKVNQR